MIASGNCIESAWLGEPPDHACSRVREVLDMVGNSGGQARTSSVGILIVALGLLLVGGASASQTRVAETSLAALPTSRPQSAAPPLRSPDSVTVVQGLAGVGAAPLAPPGSPQELQPDDLNDWLIEIASIGVSAETAAFGLTAEGVMEVPADAATVAWYGFTAVPGRSGNVVMAAHADWRGEFGVFHRLPELQPGGEIELIGPGGEHFTYAVRSIELVDPDLADVSAIIGTRDGDATLTLITCGGEFNRAAGDYERRVIVRAELVHGVSAS